MTDHTQLPSRVSTIVLGVSDIDASAAFYRDVIGLTLQGRHGGLAFLAMGDLMLMLSAELGKHVTPIAGAVEIVFPVESVEATRTILTERGCTFLNEVREVTPGSWATTLTDPDGHKLTLMGRR